MSEKIVYIQKGDAFTPRRFQDVMAISEDRFEEYKADGWISIQLYDSEKARITKLGVKYCTGDVLDVFTPFRRSDLDLEEYAKHLGYTAERMDADMRRQAIGVNAQDPLSFEKGNRVIWKTVSGWRCADLIDGRFCNHRTHENLKRALDKEQGETGK